MNREIKFRAWVNGSGLPRMIEWDDIDALEWCNDKLWHHAGEYTLLGNLELLQYTGLKDKNGKEIYEGDILSLHLFTQELGENLGVREGERITTGKITFEELGLAFTEGEGEDNWFYLVYAPGMIHEESFEIIGNIYENPSLLTP